MKTKRGFQKKFFEILKNKFVLLFFIFIIFGLAMTIAGNIIVKEGAMEVGNNLNVSNILFVDSSNNRIGIGTSTPTQPLNVVGNADFTNGTYNLYNSSGGYGLSQDAQGNLALGSIGTGINILVFIQQVVLEMLQHHYTLVVMDFI